MFVWKELYSYFRFKRTFAIFKLKIKHVFMIYDMGTMQVFPIFFLN